MEVLLAQIVAISTLQLCLIKTSDEQIINIASSALNKSQDKDVKVLVYWENDPTLMIFDPFCYAPTDYIENKYKHNERSVHVIIGKID